MTTHLNIACLSWANFSAHGISRQMIRSVARSIGGFAMQRPNDRMREGDWPVSTLDITSGAVHAMSECYRLRTVADGKEYPVNLSSRSSRAAPSAPCPSDTAKNASPAASAREEKLVTRGVGEGPTTRNPKRQRNAPSLTLRVTIDRTGITDTREHCPSHRLHDGRSVRNLPCHAVRRRTRATQPIMPNAKRTKVAGSGTTSRPMLSK